jgi:uncharacterized membrane protein
VGVTAPNVRLTAIDAVRGTVMVVMALDHVRDFVHAGAMSFQPEDLARTTPTLFMTRWVTHVCAPAFVFLAGIAVHRRLRRKGRASVSRYLLTRGLSLIIIELTLLRFALNFRFSSQDPWLLLVLCAIGVSMMILGALVFLPPAAVGAFGLAVVTLHNLFDGVRAVDLGAWSPLWLLAHQQGVFTVGRQAVVVAYPILPWAGVMALGFAAGALYDLDPRRRRRLLVSSGLALVSMFLTLRAWNQYGDPQPWLSQPTALFSILSFLRTTKYPPSLAFLLMTLGPVLLALAWFERRSLRPEHPLAVIGRVPLFYYVGHFLLAHLVTSIMVWRRYGDASLAFFSGPFPSMGGPRQAFPPDFGWPLWVVYIAWLVVVLAMYPLCLQYARFRDARRV